VHDILKRLIAQRPQNVKFMEESGYLWDDSRACFAKVLANQASRAIMSRQTVFDWLD